jgi:imidazoleglycerol-phosphate dehydratase
MRHAEYTRTTRETDIRVGVTLDGTGRTAIATPCPLFSHMLETFACHGRFDLEVAAGGDTQVDPHHLVEDCGLALGNACAQALGDKRGIARAGFFVFPMDEALVQVALDLCGRAYLHYGVDFGAACCGSLPLNVLADFFQAFAASLGLSLHIDLLRFRSPHHGAEAIFKALARSLRQACAPDPAWQGEIPSVKGVV